MMTVQTHFTETTFVSEVADWLKFFLYPSSLLLSTYFLHLPRHVFPFLRHGNVLLLVSEVVSLIFANSRSVATSLYICSKDVVTLSVYPDIMKCPQISLFPRMIRSLVWSDGRSHKRGPLYSHIILGQSYWPILKIRNLVTKMVAVDWHTGTWVWA